MEALNEKTETQKQNIDRQTFGELYSLHQKDLYRYAFFYLKNSEDAEDAVQETAMAAYRGIGGLKDSSKFKSWIFTILVRNCRHRIPDIMRMRSRVDLSDSYDFSSGDQSEEMLSAIALRDEIDCLKDKERRMLLLSVIGGYKSEEIAKIMGMRSGTVRSILSRTVAKLRVKLSD